MKDQECMFRNCINGGLSLSCLDVAAFSFAILHILKSLASLACLLYQILMFDTSKY
jgi:hypothetical protein